MDQEKFDSIVALLKGLNSSGTLNTSDLSIMQNAILGVLTDTYTPPKVGRTSDELLMEYAPDLAAASDSADALQQSIAGKVINGEDILTIRAYIRSVLKENVTQMAMEDAPTESDYMSLIDKFKTQWRTLQSEERKNEREIREADPFLKEGLPAFGERYQATDVNRDVFEKLATDYAKNPYVPKRNPQQRVMQPTSTTPNTSLTSARNNLKNAPYRPNFPGESKTELDAIREELKAKRVYDPNAKYTPYFPGESDADVRRIAQERQAAKNTTETTSGTTTKTTSGTVAKTKQLYAPGEKVRSGTFDAEKAKLAGNSPERMARVAEALVALLQPKLDASGNTPLKDALAARGIFATAAAIPKKTSQVNKNYTVKGPNVVKKGK